MVCFMVFFQERPLPGALFKYLRIWYSVLRCSTWGECKGWLTKLIAKALYRESIFLFSALFDCTNSNSLSYLYSLCNQFYHQVINNHFNALNMEAYIDVDYAGSVNDRRSTSGYCTFMCENLVTWRSKVQWFDQAL